ncbi:MAG: hypothetical protein JJD98_12035 [Polaromonas sp.]|nr:hypothetical protein [Polaromonas sp.]
MQYRRAFTPGGTFFFTLVTQERRAVFASAAAVEALRGAFRLDWPYSSFCRHGEAGVYPVNWGENVMEFKDIGHE